MQAFPGCYFECRGTSRMNIFMSRSAYNDAAYYTGCGTPMESACARARARESLSKYSIKECARVAQKAQPSTLLPANRK